MKIRNLLLASFLVAAPLVPLPASASVVCENGICTQSFQFTGSQQSWQVPTGVTKISFKVYGASGGRGGAGGEIRGELTNLPSTLYVFVGGQGIEGNNAPGGYNGGGATTGNRGNEGSGGGASDIRFGFSLSDRVVVAGGGGGAGGYAGAPGGMGGGLIAEAGGSGQGGGGGGGTQTSGGSAGFSNGGSPATSGSFGIGGTGGFSWNAGGGGGGGGWYGGGGGGPDDNSCCSDGGGGGGGSSYARSDITLNVQHQAGVNTGNGRVEISYQQIISVVSFTGEQIDSELAEFQLVMSANITGLTQEDFETTPLSCSLAGIAVNGTQAVISLAQCPHGTVSMTLKSNSLASGPVSSVTSTITFDKEAPSFSWGEIAETTNSQNQSVSFNLSEGDLLVESLDLGQCQGQIEAGILQLQDCPEGANAVSLLAYQLSDQWGNVGPAEPVSLFFVVDISAPDGVWSEVEITQGENYRYAALLTFSEPVTFDPIVVNFVSDSDCISGFDQTDNGWSFFADCSYASGSWSLPELSVMDEVGNLGPSIQRVAVFSNPQPITTPDPQPEAQPESQPQLPDQPAPIESQPAVNPVSPELIVVPPVEQGVPTPVTELPIEIEPAPIFVIENPPLLPQPIAPESSTSDPVSAELEVVQPEQEEVEAIEESEAVEVPVQQASAESQPLQSEAPYLWIGAAALLILLLIVAGWRLIGR